MVDLHRHDEYSTFDGFGKAKELAILAKELGHTSLGLTNHGNTNGLIQQYFDCNEFGVKPIMGVEAYFLPKWKEQTRGFHLCLFAKNLEGYGNLNRLLWDAEEKGQKYFNTIVTFEQLEKFSEGIICTSACIAGYISQCVVKENYTMADRAIEKFKKIYGDDFYIEIQPYKIDDEKTQETVNVRLIELAEEHGVKCVLTSDSHYGAKEDFETYLKMHEIAGHDLDWVKSTYGERYMPTEKEIYKRFVKMHSLDFDKKEEESKQKCLQFGREMLKNLQEIEEKVEDKILDDLPMELPRLFEDHDSYELLEKNVKEGLKKHDHWNKKYIARCKEELEVIKAHGFADYFLIVQDYVNHAKDEGIYVGPGRGSVCNSQVAYELEITSVDSLKFGLDFRRFLRMDKKKLPDVDLDFETSRRQEVIDYMVEKYPGHASQICSYGLYKIDNLINDLGKVCGLDTTGDLSEEEKKDHKRILAEIKSFLKSFESNDGVDMEGIKATREYKEYNRQYDNILLHFTKLHHKVRFIGTHAAGVAITGGKLLDYVGLRKDKSGKIFTNYDLADLDRINVVKFDFLGLKTMESLGELRRLTGRDNRFDITPYLEDKEVLRQFAEGNTDGVFQFVSGSAKNIAKEIQVDNFEDVVAASSMNRPGPLSLKMPTTYAHNKLHQDDIKKDRYWEFTKETYGTIVYQEQLMQICVNIGEMEWGDADKVMKIQKRSGQNAAALTGANAKVLEVKDELIEKFIKGAMHNGYTRQEAYDFFQSLLVYTFNKGHGVGYSLISFEEMFYKVHHPTEYWYVKVKYSKDEQEFRTFCEKAVANGVVVFLPHVNYSRGKTSLRKEDGERIIQQGLADINGVGEKAAEFIREERMKNGVFRSFDDFYDRCKSRVVTSRVIDILKEQGAIELDKKKYLKRVVAYNSALYMRGCK